MNNDVKIPSDQALNAALSRMRRRTPPPDLSARLRVMASREHERHMRLRTLGTVLASWRGRAHLVIQNMMRPLALPAAGGLLSAVALFGLWLVPTYPLRGNSSFDVPTGLMTYPVLTKTAPFGATSEDLVVDVNVDGQGRMIDYSVVSGGSALKNDALRSRIENTLFFAEFDPATSFGQPMTGKVRLVLRSSSVDVKG